MSIKSFSINLIRQRLPYYFSRWWFKVIKFLLISIISYTIFRYFFLIILAYHILLIEIFCLIFLLLLLYNTYSSLGVSKHIVLWGGSSFLILNFLMFFGWSYIPSWVIFYLYIKFYLESIKTLVYDISWVLAVSYQLI